MRARAGWTNGDDDSLDEHSARTRIVQRLGARWAAGAGSARSPGRPARGGWARYDDGEADLVDLVDLVNPIAPADPGGAPSDLR